MYRPSFENLTSDTEEMISEKKDLFDGSSSSSNTVQPNTPCLVSLDRGGLKRGNRNARLACLSHRACSRISASLTVPFELE